MSKTGKLTSTDVLNILQKMYSGSGWVLIRELKLGTGKAKRDPARGQPRRIKQRMDAWAYNTWPSTPEIVAFEVKVSRADFLAELATPEKRRAAMELSNRFYFVVGPDVLHSVSEVPEGCGLLVVDPNNPNLSDYPIHVVEAPWREIDEWSVPIPQHLLNSLIRRLGKAEGTYVEPVRIPRRRRRLSRGRTSTYSKVRRTRSRKKKVDL